MNKLVYVLSFMGLLLITTGLLMEYVDTKTAELETTLDELTNKIELVEKENTMVWDMYYSSVSEYEYYE